MMASVPDDELQRRCTVAKQVTAEAGAAAHAAFMDRDRLQIQTKGAQDWVTNVDMEVENLIRERLAFAFPGEPVLGEEKGLSEGDDSSGVWVIDPIDGTTCFLLGLPHWCVVLCYVVGTAPVVAAIFVPTANEMFVAMAGHGAFLNDKKIRTTDALSVADGLISIGAAQTSDPARSGRFITDLVTDGGMYVRLGSCAAALAAVAAGRLLAAYEPLVSPWDDLAGMLLVREAGGITNPYSTDLTGINRRPVIAAAPGVWPAMRPLIDAHGLASGRGQTVYF